jgi:hypothetical protein
MAIVEIVNGSKQTVRLDLDPEGDQFAYFRKLVQRGDLVSVEVVKSAPARKPATSTK